MAITTSVSREELKRIAQLAYEGETLKVMLCNIGITSYNAENTVTEWQSVEITGTGYVRYSEVIGTGAYNTTTGRYELPAIQAEFTSTDITPWDYTTVVLYIDGSTYPHSILTESPNVLVAEGQTITYQLTLNTDD